MPRDARPPASGRNLHARFSSESRSKTAMNQQSLERADSRAAVSGLRSSTREDHLRHDSLIPLDTRTILDVGCGRGGNAAWLHGKGIAVDAISCSREELKAVRPFSRRAILWDLNQGLPEMGSELYDGIICSHVLEHIAYPEKLLNDLRRALVPGGFLLIVIPNLLFWSDRIKLLRGEWQYESSGTFDYTHVRWYTAASMHRVVSDYGLVPDAFIAEGWVPLPGLRLLIGSKLRSRLNKIACRVSPDRKSTSLNSSHVSESRMPSSA